ncbi:16S rRNA (adenine(1518)-N(6)/adenine(1519)-N(6))-dimethyltransferase RsmA [Fimbriimonas ginsengisoli]|uniref:Ribosomal RNA small subunit methyltransferase A n=1 Tax=Fimbriimonas ginsengisoli Gsoil 348 TaxID=661478 RepID=A0A068NVP3_FIMGI|nr:16S rRNA (adenine(1518)-N(6)/adenine(1519)-N(6))-dimethyltransferase RsmA [Fimbriimonas ginsengisoli]AIE86865.1 dimethyladenosine transferase [Fimbriimonas ginsengisoli Gsoil 348]
MRLYDPGTLKAFLARHGLDATKSLGQNFLVSSRVVDKIVNAAHGCSGVCEIGPGPGVLTQPLSEQAERLIALELDPRMAVLLAESSPRAEVRQADALKIDLAALLDELPGPRAIVSNMPYYITGPLLQRVADVRGHFDRAILMMQREVAQRVVAPPASGERGSLSVYLQTLFEIRPLAEAPSTVFLPPPKVDSSVLLFVPRQVDVSDFYFKLIRLGFAQPRKTLANNLAAGLKLSRGESIPILEELGMWEKTRAQELDEASWRALADRLAPLPSDL